MSLDPKLVRQNWLNFLARESEDFADQYKIANYLRYNRLKKDNPAMAMIKEQIYREALIIQEHALERLLKKVNDYFTHEGLGWDKLLGD